MKIPWKRKRLPTLVFWPGEFQGLYSPWGGKKLDMKILQARLQQHVNHEIPDVQAGFRKVRGTRGQITNISWIIEKARKFQKNIYFCFIDSAKTFDCGTQQTVENSEINGNTRPPDLLLGKLVCRTGSNS